MHRKCSVPECGRRHSARGMCNTHYQRWIKSRDLSDPPGAYGTAEQRFWRAVEKGADGACWGWNLSTNQGGYAQFEHEPASRFSWRLHFGEIPAGRFVLHRCDDRVCTNPGHLFLGDHAANMADMVEKARSLAGPRNPQARLTWEQVAEIRAAPATVTHASLAARFGVTDVTISSVRRCRTYRDEPALTSGPPS